LQIATNLIILGPLEFIHLSLVEFSGPLPRLYFLEVEAEEMIGLIDLPTQCRKCKNIVLENNYFLQLFFKVFPTHFMHRESL